jgi:hypothetical protein
MAFAGWGAAGQAALPQSVLSHAAGGGAGVVHVLRSILAETDLIMAVGGHRGLPRVSPMVDRWEDADIQRARIRLDLASLRRSSPNDSQARKTAKIP